jgi:hypothetical protein
MRPGSENSCLADMYPLWSMCGPSMVSLGLWHWRNGLNHKTGHC